METPFYKNIPRFCTTHTKTTRAETEKKTQRFQLYADGNSNINSKNPKKSHPT
jgi:hypothetical protein